MLNNIRRDEVADRLVIISPKDTSKKSDKTCPYCPGNEKMTNPSTLSLVEKDGILQRLQDIEENYVTNWSIRTFESAQPALSTNAENEYGEKPLYYEPAYGYHHIIVATPNHKETFSTLNVAQWSNVLVVIQEKIKWLYTQKNVAYISLCIDQGEEAGSKYDHPYVDVITFPMIPPVIEKEIKTTSEIMDESGICPMCKSTEDEYCMERQILKTNGFIAFCPWSPSHPFEFCICPVKHATIFSKITQKEIVDLATILCATLGGLGKINPKIAYSIVFHLSPEKRTTKLIHWHIEVYPITHKKSGMEYGYGVFLNDTSPEEASVILRTEARKVLADIVGIN